METDLLVFGPHPDDIEIGIGGTAATWRLVIRSACAIRAARWHRTERPTNASPKRKPHASSWVRPGERISWQIAPSAVTIRCSTLRD